MSSLRGHIKTFVRQPWRLAVFFKRVFLILLLLAIALLSYYWAIENVRARQNIILSVIVLWLATAYYLLPRIHRLLSRIYVPHYFIGRARTIDGLLADPVNLAIRGGKAELLSAMNGAGWQLADKINLRTSIKMVRTTLKSTSYANAPVSDLFVFGHRHDLAFQKEVDGNPAKRHHVRFWRVPRDSYLPGGYKVDWVAAASYDDAVGFSLWTLQVTHTIDGDVDAERDFVIETLKKVKATAKTQKIKHFFPRYSHRNGGGHKYFTDGSMVIVDLKIGGRK